MIDLKAASLLELAVMYANIEDGPPVLLLDIDAEIARRGADADFDDIYNRLENGSD